MIHAQAEGQAAEQGKRTTRTPSARRAHAALPERVDVAIVGSGLGGLVSAALLAQAGLSVAVFEGHYTAGGCATQFARGPKRAQYHFDVGLHYIGDCGEEGTIPRILREAGAPSLAFRPMDQDGFDRLVFPDLELRIPASLDVYRDRLVQAFPSERRPIDRYVALLRAVMRAARAMEREGRPPLRDLVPLAAAALRVAPHRDRTIAEVFAALRLRDPKLVAVLLGQSGDYGLPPRKVSALLHLGLAGHYFRGAYYPEGGGQVIADTLAARVEALGGSIHLRHPVERVLVERGRASGVRVAARAGAPARDVRAHVVLSNADYKKTLLELVGAEHLPSEAIARAHRAEMAAALFMTFLGVEGTIEGMGASNVWQFDAYDMEGFYADDASRPVTARGCYITSASHKDPAHALHHAPCGIANVEVMTVVPGAAERFAARATDIAAWNATGAYRQNEAYDAVKRRLEDDMIRRLDVLFPGTAARVVFRESATPVSHVRYTQAEGGTGYGLAATPSQFMKGRPGYRSPLSSLYLTGASTRAGHGVVGAMMSGRAAARRILADLAKNQRSSSGSTVPSMYDVQ